MNSPPDLIKTPPLLSVQTVLSITCEKCNAPLGVKAVKADGFRLWHPECLTCYNCGRKLSDKWFFIKKACPFCEKCYSYMYFYRCTECSRPLRPDGTGIKAMESKFHQKCFRCQACLVEIKKVFTIFKKRPMCFECYIKEAEYATDTVDKNSFHYLTQDMPSSASIMRHQGEQEIDFD